MFIVGRWCCNKFIFLFLKAHLDELILDGLSYKMNMKFLFSFLLISLLGCNNKTCDSIISIGIIEKPILDRAYYGRPAICFGLEIKNKSKQDSMIIDANDLIYFYNEKKEKSYLNKSSVSNSIFKVVPNSVGQFCLYLDKRDKELLIEFYEKLVKATFFIERNQKEIMICKSDYS